MPSSGVKTTVSDYEHLNSKYPINCGIDKDDGNDSNESDDFLPLIPPKPSQDQALIVHRLNDMNNSNIGVSQVQTQGAVSLTHLLNNFGQIESQRNVPVPVAWSPGMLIRPDPALLLTPQKPQSVYRSSGSTKENVLESQDLNKMLQNMKLKPGMVIQPDPNLFITPEKLVSRKTVSSIQGSGNMTQSDVQKENLSEATLRKSKEKFSVRFDLPSTSSGDDTANHISDTESPITLKGSEFVADGQSYGGPLVWKNFSPSKAYNPSAYSDESSLDESYLNSVPTAKPRPLLSITTGPIPDNLTADKSDLILESEVSMPAAGSRFLLSSSFPPRGLGKQSTHASVTQHSTSNIDLAKEASMSLIQPQKLEDNKQPSRSSTIPNMRPQQKDNSLNMKAGPQFLKAPSSMYEPHPPSPYVVREHKNNLESTEYSFPFDVGAVGGDFELEHTFARPEFNSTLRVRSELDGLCEHEVDVKRALETVLAKSEPKRLELNEKAASYTNRISDQFRNLVALDTSVEGLCERVVRMRTTKAPSKKKIQLSDKGQNGAHRVPDLMEFFSSDLQMETLDLTLPGMKPMTSQLRTAPNDLAFDLYRHNRAWLGVNDFW